MMKNVLIDYCDLILSVHYVIKMNYSTVLLIILLFHIVILLYCIVLLYHIMLYRIVILDDIETFHNKSHTLLKME